MSEFELMVSDNVHLSYPNANIGIMAVQLEEVSSNDPLIDTKIIEIVEDLNARFSDPLSVRNHEVIKAYSEYYQQFRKTYHVLPQLESVIFKGKPISSPFPLLKLIFAAELKNMLLTAVHDLGAVSFPISVGVASGDEIYQQMNGTQAQLKEGDIYISDADGVISSIIYGPDQRTKINPGSQEILVCVYAPGNIGRNRIEAHFDDILDWMSLISLRQKVLIREMIP